VVVSLSVAVFLSLAFSLSLCIYECLRLKERERESERGLSDILVYVSGYSHTAAMGWLRLVGCLKSKVFFAENSLFYRALLQKRHTILRSLLIVATPYVYVCVYVSHCGYDTAAMSMSMSMSMPMSASLFHDDF